jgi:CRISPR-associated protein Cas1
MPTVYLTEQQSVVKKEGDTLIVQLPQSETRDEPRRKIRIPLIKVDRVVVQGNITLTSPALAALLENHAEVTLLDAFGRYQGHLAPAFSKNGQLRLAQAAAHQSHTQRHHLARSFVQGKITNLRTLLMRFNRKHQNEAMAQAVTQIKQIINELNTLEPDALPPDPQRPQANSAYGRLQGFEGQASALYFQNFRHLLNQPDLFSGRTRRPPLDPVNALLSYGYTILLNQVMSALCTVGLDPYIGYLHGTRFGKPALALDLMEEFRPIIVDSVVLTLFNNNILQAKDFITELGGACRLTDSARRTFLTKLEARFDETITHPTFDYKATYRRSLELQARLLAKTLMAEIPAYPPFTVR